MALLAWEQQKARDAVPPQPTLYTAGLRLRPRLGNLLNSDPESGRKGTMSYKSTTGAKKWKFYEKESPRDHICKILCCTFFTLKSLK